LEAPSVGTLTLVGAHLDYRDPGARERQVTELLARLSGPGPRVLLGDLNSISHEDGLGAGVLAVLPAEHVPRHRNADGSLATAVTRRLTGAGFVDSWAAARRGGEEGATVPTEVPSPPRFGRLRLDYAFLSGDVAGRLAAVRVVRTPDSARASDHYPVVVDLHA
jgi:endonuclease/exonuclease/phosphatase family metal-dependent hydrolase